MLRSPRPIHPSRAASAFAAPLLTLLAVAVLGSAPAPGEQQLPELSSPVRIGVGGDYPNGIDGQLSALGLPYRRIFQWELDDPEVLREYDVLLLSCVPEAQGGIDAALLEWLKAGGRAYVETWAAQQRFPLAQVVKVSGGAPQLGDVVVTAADHPIASALDPSAPINMHHLQGVRVEPTEPDGARIIAHYCPNEGREPVPSAGAVVCVSLGEGELVYSGAPLAFARFHRGRSPEKLLVGIIRYLVPEGAVPRLWFAEPEGEQPPPEEPAEEQPLPAGAPPVVPEGFTYLDTFGDEPYNVLATLGPPAGDGGASSILLLDGQHNAEGKATRPCLWLQVDGERIELRTGRTPSGRAIAGAAWEPSQGAAPLVVRRRPGLASVLLGDTELMRSRVRLRPGGAVAVRNGSVAISDPLCQPVDRPVFSDDFMREPSEPTPWTQVSGQWKNVGVGNEDYSINGFYFLGQDGETALATAGDWFWEEYTFAAAVRLEDAAGTCGLCGLVQQNGDRVAFVADSAAATSPRLRIVRVHDGRESELAGRDGSLAPKQWYRLGLNLADGTIEALLDGETVLSCPNPEARGGAVGLLVHAGAARFDDVTVQPAEDAVRIPRDEGSPEAHLPPSLGPHDYMTWASPAESWVACPDQPARLWHEGVFFGDLEASLAIDASDRPTVRRLILAPSTSASEDRWISASVRTSPGTETARLTLCRPGRRPVARPVDLRTGRELRLARRGRTASVLWNGKSVLRVADAGDHRRVGLEVEGPPVLAERLHVHSPWVRDYMFGVAPTDWWVSGGTWEVAARWACDNRWSWLAGWGNGDVAIWNKDSIDGDVMVEYYVGIKMQAPGGPETQRCRDLNTVLCGDRSDPRTGYSLILGGDGGVPTQLLRNGEVVAENSEIRVPSGYNVHHRWLRVRAARIGKRVELDFEGRPVIRYEDAQPLAGGYVGLWTRNSGILIPRVTIYHSDSKPND